MNISTAWFAGTPEAEREKRALAGLALLDEKYGPDKVNAMDLERLDVRWNADCPLGQVSGVGYNAALSQVGLKDDYVAKPLGLYPVGSSELRRTDDAQRLTAIFRRKINERRAARGGIAA